MLVLSRQEGEVAIVGDDRTVMAQLSADEEVALRQCSDARLRELAGRLLSTLGSPIEVTNVTMRPDKTRIGFEAPKAIPVHRKEVYQRMHKDHGDVNPGWSSTPTAAATSAA